MPILADALQDAGCDSEEILPTAAGRVRTFAGAGQGVAWKPNRSLHLTRPRRLFPTAHRLVVVVIGLAAGQVSF
jgi:hypothetical protein